MSVKGHGSDRRVRAVLIAGAMAVSALVAWKTAGTGGDYISDAGPAIDQFAGGHFMEGLREPTPLMGPLSILVRVPFVVVAHAFGSSRATDYRLGCFACILPAGLIAAALARRASTAATKGALGLLFVVVAIATPAVTNAVELGHPEEILAAALAVLAVTAATAGRPWATAILLGLAVATKQWAALAIPSALILFPGIRVRMLAVAGAVATGLTLPQLLVSPFGYWSMSKSGVGSLSETRALSWWYLLGHHVPHWFAASVDHPAIALLAGVGALALRWRQRVDTDVLGLLSLTLLLRCTLDTADISYYHAPFFFSLLAWESVVRRRAFPYLTVGSVACLVVTESLLEGRLSESNVAVFYSAWTAATAGALLFALCARRTVPLPPSLREVVHTPDLDNGSAPPGRRTSRPRSTFVGNVS